MARAQHERAVENPYVAPGFRCRPVSHGDTSLGELAYDNGDGARLISRLGADDLPLVPLALPLPTEMSLGSHCLQGPIP